jgi:hypothetical protein
MYRSLNPKRLERKKSREKLIVVGLVELSDFLPCNSLKNRLPAYIMSKKHIRLPQLVIQHRWLLVFASMNLATSNASVVTAIATAAEEPSATSEEISKAIEEVNHIVGETSAEMLQASAAVHELSKMTQELNRVVDTLQ